VCNTLFPILLGQLVDELKFGADRQFTSSAMIGIVGHFLAIAPYATGLAFLIDPLQALANLRRLGKEGAEGPWGWYEAIDYTSERLPTAAGTGFSSARGLAITRWREDTATDIYGQFIYLRDVSTGQFWSAGYQPVATEADAYEVTFNADKIEFRRRDGHFETRMEITITPERHAEVRRLTVVNHDDRPHDAELTSYLEVVLLPQATDVAHPAFGKLFQETEFVPDNAALLCRRRRRSPEQRPIWCIHVMASEGRTIGSIQYETDRARFLGRSRTPASPAALDPEAAPLSGTVGAVLDPTLSLRRRFRIPAGASIHVAFTTALADSHEEALALADAGKDLHSVHRAFELAWAHTQVELRQQHWTAAETHLFQRLAAHLFFAGKALREAPALVAKNRQGQTDLWRLGLSGDLPIVLVRITAAEELPLVRQVMAAHTFWRLKGLAANLVILNEEAGAYFEELDQQLQLLLRASDERTLLDKPGGVFLRKSAHINPADLLLLQASARCALVASRGLLGVQLDRLERTRTLGGVRGERREASQKVVPGSPIAAPGLAFDNGLGGFSADGKEYVLRIGDAAPGGSPLLPPQPWVNVIANPNFGTLVSETGGGFTWAINSQTNRITPWQNDPVSDPNGEVVYLRDDGSGDLWSATPQPCGAGASFIVKHGQGYSTFEHERGQLACKLTVFVAHEEPIKFFKLTVRNLGAQTRRVSAIFYAELVLGAHRGRNAPHVVTEIDAETEAILARNSWDAEFKDKVAFADVNQRPREVTADRTEFIGRNGTLTAPAACARAQLAGAVGLSRSLRGVANAIGAAAPGRKRYRVRPRRSRRHRGSAASGPHCSRSTAVGGLLEGRDRLLGSVHQQHHDPHAGRGPRHALQSLAAVSDSQLPHVGTFGALSIRRRVRVPRAVARLDGTGLREAGRGSQASLARRRPAICGRRCAALVARPRRRRRPHAHLRRLLVAAVRRPSLRHHDR
jgi:cyclic beta-1,2-glucan synthetase